MAASNYYPSLSDLISLEIIPEEFENLDNGIEGLLDKLFYKNYFSSRSSDGATINTKIDIISYNEIAYDLGATGFRLLINPGSIPMVPFELSIGASVVWPVLAFIPNAQGLSNLNFEKEGLIDMIFQIAGVNYRTLFEKCLPIAFPFSGDPINELVTNYN